MNGAIKQQAICWSNVDPYLRHRMASLGHNELIVMESLAIVSYYHSTL